MLTALSELDYTILQAIQDHIRTPFLTPLFQFITMLGNAGRIWILLSLLLLWRRDTRKTGGLSLVSMLLSFLINNMLLKNLVARARPYDSHDSIILLTTEPHDYSFPSGHAASSFACAIVMFLCLPRKYGVPAMILAVLISLSRLYVGVHYPLDVLAGSISGLCIGFLTVYVWRRIAFSGQSPA